MSSLARDFKRVLNENRANYLRFLQISQFKYQSNDYFVLTFVDYSYLMRLIGAIVKFNYPLWSEIRR